MLMVDPYWLYFWDT